MLLGTHISDYFATAWKKLLCFLVKCWIDFSSCLVWIKHSQSLLVISDICPLSATLSVLVYKFLSTKFRKLLGISWELHHLKCFPFTAVVDLHLNHLQNLNSFLKTGHCFIFLSFSPINASYKYCIPLEPLIITWKIVPKNLLRKQNTCFAFALDFTFPSPRSIPLFSCSLRDNRPAQVLEWRLDEWMDSLSHFQEIVISVPDHAFHFLIFQAFSLPFFLFF